MSKKEDVLQRISRSGIVAILRLSDLTECVEMCRALLAGGVTALEFPFTNPNAADAIAEVRKRIPAFDAGEAVIGAGTVLTVEQAQKAADRGAEFVVSPAFDAEVLAHCVKENLPMMPGAYTPTEILLAWSSGATAVKVFPARALGPAFIKDVREPMPFLKLMPTGGVDEKNVGAYLAAGALAVGVGGNLIQKSMVASKNWAALQHRASEYANAVRLAREN